MRRMEMLANAARQLALLAALSAATELFLTDCPARRGVELLTCLATALAIAALLPLAT